VGAEERDIVLVQTIRAITLDEANSKNHTSILQTWLPLRL
jgi:hypothetical protein